FVAHQGDLQAVAEELFGKGAQARKVHLRLNQLGLSVKTLRGERT
ncbi:MAG: hypothetical protein JST92_18125, partial [Deltaproteobacteria bacterium]|nr:hypothetical protein [Deltaproteobacteria bacterium]